MKPCLPVALLACILSPAGQALCAAEADFPFSAAGSGPLRAEPALALNSAVAAANAEFKDWKCLWRPSGTSWPASTKVHIGPLGALGEDLENREWLMVSTRHHQVLFQESADRKKVAELCQVIDGLYVFLEGRSPVKPATPIRAFLVPKERGRSRCTQTAPAMRTGELGDLPFLLTSLLHEETHLFNFAFLGPRAQGWWTGEFCCLYFQERAWLEHAGRDLKQEIQARLPRGPAASLAELDARGKAAFDEALAAQFFFEQTYGRKSFNEFRRQCLLASKNDNGGRLPARVFQQAFGRTVASLDEEWRAYYGWTSAPGQNQRTSPEIRLEVKVTYATERESVQHVVLKLAEQAGLGYNFDTSKAQTDPLCRQWVRNVSIKNQPCREALDTILGPVGLRYEIENEAVVLYRK